MPRLAFAAVLLVLASQTAAQQPAEPKKTDMELLQGEWLIVGLESGGKQQPAQHYKGNTFTFRRDKGTDTVVLKEASFQPIVFDFSIDSTKTPKWIELKSRGNEVRGIYKLDGDDLTLCISIGGPRPTEFATKAGGDTETFTLKRSPWERYTDKAFGFSVDFPGKPAEKKRDEMTTIYTVRNDPERVSYVLSVTRLPGRLDAREAEAALDAARKAVVAEVEKSAKVTAEEATNTKVTIPVPGPGPGPTYPAKELTLALEVPDAKDKGAMRVRLFVVGDRMYSLAVTGTEEGTKSRSADRFWNSFRLPPEPKKKDPPGKQ